MKQSPVSVKNDSDVDRRIRLSDGRWLGYSEYGDPMGKPILSFHGGLSSRIDIAFASSLCCSKHIRILSVDRPGIGLSDPQDNRRLLDWPEDICELASTLDLKKFALLGWSAGGPYALACAFKIPHLLTNVGIAGGMCPLDRPGAVQELGLLVDRVLFPLAEKFPEFSEVLIKLAKYVPPAILKWMLKQELQCLSDRQLIASLSVEEATNFFCEAIRFNVQGTVDDYRILGSDWGFKSRDISMKILLWQGKEDYLLPMKHANQLAKQLQDFELFIIPNQGHFLLRSIIDEVLSALISER